MSYSNPSRQCLFDFNDAKENKFKSVAAADQLLKKCPYITARGIVMNIPMPGHQFYTTPNENDINKQKEKYGNSTWVFEDGAAEECPVTALDDLIRNHDCVFSLLDSREGRWLPTLLCSVHNTLMITAALGFDSYLVMRHGQSGNECSTSQEKEILSPFTHEKLGCYFCSDIVSPNNSQTDRSIDQQCTVTRAGMSQIAGALAVELMVSTIQESLSSSGKYIPHQLRGDVSSFGHRIHEVPAFDCCVACSQAVVEKYQTDGLQFVRNVCNDGAGSFLQETSGITNLTKGLDEALVEWEISDDES